MPIIILIGFILAITCTFIGILSAIIYYLTKDLLWDKISDYSFYALLFFCALTGIIAFIISPY